MSRGNAGNAANKGLGDHLKAGLKQIPGTYKALYGPGRNASKAVLGSGGKIVQQKVPLAKAVGKTMATNVKFIAKGRDPNTPKSDVVGQAAKDRGVRAGMAAMGAASVTPLGPVAAFAVGVKNSVQQKKAAVAAQNKTSLKQAGATGSAQVGARPGAKPVASASTNKPGARGVR